MKQIIDRIYNPGISTLDRMIVELSKYMTPLEVDQAVDFLETLKDTRHDVNWSETDAKTQLELMFGSQRYKELKESWTNDNQHLTKDTGIKKYRDKQGFLWDGLDSTDNPNDFTEVWI